MALKVLMLRNRKRQKEELLEQQRARATELQAREAELEADIEQANTDEERAAVDAAIDQHEADMTENAQQIETLESEIAELDRQLEEVENAQQAATPTPDAGTVPAPLPRSNHNDMDQRGRFTIMSNVSRRELTRRSLENADVRSFYQGIANMAKNRAAGSIENTELVIPEIVMDRINDRMGDYATVAREVESISVGGTSRIILDGADPEAIWVEMSGAISELQADFVKVEMDGFKLAGFMAIPNDIIEDSMINLAEYVEKKLAKAIAKSRDKAILKGTGPTGKQMVGIIPSLAPENKPAAMAFELGEILSQVSLVDDGEETYGEIIAVMKRSTFYRHFVRKLITVDSNGRYVVPNLSQPNIGVRVVMSQYMDENTVLFGDYKRYMIAMRSGMKIEASKDVRFIEDQTVIKGLQRMDGKPIHVDENNQTKDWVLVTISDT